MVYGYYITDTAGNKRFFVEGCNYCSMSTGGQHQAECPCKNLKVADKPLDFPIIHINSPKRAREV